MNTPKPQLTRHERFPVSNPTSNRLVSDSSDSSDSSESSAPSRAPTPPRAPLLARIVALTLPCSLVVALAVAPACVKKQRSSVKSTGDALDLESLVAEGEPIRLALVNPESLSKAHPGGAKGEAEALVKRTWENIVESKAIMPAAPKSPLALSQSLYGVLNLGARYAKENRKTEGGVLRHDAFAINADIARIELQPDLGSKNVFHRTLSLPFELKKGTEVHVARFFANDKEADAAPRIDFARLPLDAERALLMKPGEYVGVPAKTAVFLNVNAAFLQKNASKVAALKPFLENALTGTLSAIPEGHLVGQGLFHFHVLRLEGNKVRVKVSSHREVQAGAKLHVDGGVVERYVFLPATTLGKVRMIKHVAAFRKPQNLRDLARSVGDAKAAALPAVFAQYSKIEPAFLQGTEADEALLRKVSEGVDRLVAGVEKLAVGIEEINKRTSGRFDEIVGQLNDNTFDRIDQWVDRTIDARAAVDLGADFAKGVRMLADYEVDLSTPEGKIAYDRMVSGRVVMQARDQVLTTAGLKKAFLADFSYADDLATEDAGKPSKRVVRKARMVDSHGRGAYDIAFKFLSLGRSFSKSWKENEITVTGDDGSPVNYKLKLWEFKNSLRMGESDSEAKGSGVLYPSDGQGTATAYGNYFYTWKRSFAGSHPSPISDTLRQAINVTGPVAYLLGLPRHYAGEYPGETTVTVSITFLPDSMRSFFDPDTTTREHLWTAFASLAKGWDNDHPDPIPMLAGPFASSRLKEDYAKRACDALPFHFGGGWCNFFQGEFLPQWEEAARSRNVAAQIAFLQRFYTQGLLANKFGGDLLARMVSETLYVKHGKDALKGVVISVDYENSDEASEVANPDFSFGTDPAGAVVRAINESFE